MPNVKSIRLKTKELQSYKVDVAISAGKASWDHFLSSEAPLFHQKDLMLMGVSLIIRSTSYHWKDLPASGVSLIIGSTSYHWKDLSSSGVLFIIGETSSCSTSCCR